MPDLLEWSSRHASSERATEFDELACAICRYHAPGRT